MDWSRIKTIFIITFLILDVYLFSQFMIKRDASQYEIATEASVEERLKDNGITVVDMPNTIIKDQYVSAKLKEFTEKGTKKLEGQDQSVKIGPNTMITSYLDKPYQIDPNFEPVSLSGFIAENALYGSDYQYWEKDSKKKTITYFQQYQNKFFYQNNNGMIVFHYNDDNQITYYEQTYLEDIKKVEDKEEEVLKPFKAIEILFEKGLLEPKTNITKAELGYSTFVPLSSSQVFAPTWRFIINDSKSLYVNAFEGQVIEFDSNEN